MAANHLPTEDMIDMALYASHYNILTASRLSPIGASIIWQEVFPTRRKQVDDTLKDPFYVEVEGRYFLLIVAYVSARETHFATCYKFITVLVPPICRV